MVRVCPHCGGTDIDEDAARGDATCMECGTVLEESIVVAENQFQERAGGSGHTLVGQFLSMERQSHSVQGIPGLVSQESRELTYQKGRRLIEEIASQLRISSYCIETSYNFFKMCVVKNLTRGRVRSHVVAACMYMTCRLDNTAHLLLDFSDVTQVNVFDLGRCLSFLSRSLRINLPSSDPCLYIMRFACCLEFGEKQKDVVNLATRLVERMKRDWISTGRRPTGLCGAALLIAARAYNFNRSITDIVRVVHISETVVRKRLEEFSQTPSGALSIDDFQTIDLEQTEDPPAFLAARKKAREQQMKKEQQMAEKMQNEVQNLEAEVEKALEKRRRDKFKNSEYAKELTGVDQFEVGKNEAAFVNQHILDSVYEAVDGAEQSNSAFSQFGPTLQSLGLGKQENLIEYTDAPPLPTRDNENGELNTDDIDDDEIDSYILSNAESQVKERFWMKANGEHLKDMERRKREREEAEAKDTDVKKKRKKPNPSIRHDNGIIPTTAAEAIEKVIQEKRLSNKVNYNILKEIDTTLPGSSEEALPNKPKVEPAGLMKRERMIARKNFHVASHVRLNIIKDVLCGIQKKEEPKEVENELVEAKKEEIDEVDEKPALMRRFSKIRPNIKPKISDAKPSTSKETEKVEEKTAKIAEESSSLSKAVPVKKEEVPASSEKKEIPLQRRAKQPPRLKR